MQHNMYYATLLYCGVLQAFSLKTGFDSHFSAAISDVATGLPTESFRRNFSAMTNAALAKRPPLR